MEKYVCQLKLDSLNYKDRRTTQVIIYMMVFHYWVKL